MHALMTKTKNLTYHSVFTLDSGSAETELEYWCMYICDWQMVLDLGSACKQVSDTDLPLMRRGIVPP